MRNAILSRMLPAVGSSLVVLALLAAQPTPAAQAAGPFEVGVEAYVYGYPLVMMGLTEEVTTNVPNGTTVLGRAPINQFANATVLPNASYTDVVLPNVNTLYSLAWLDLTREPVILHVPDMGSRFFLFEVLDAWTNVNPSSPGARSATQAGNYAFVGPNWKGTLPAGMSGVYSMPTNTVWIIARTYTDGSAADIATVVNTLQPQYTLTPLNKFGKSYTPDSHAPVNPQVDMTTPPFEQVDNMDAGTFFKGLADLMRSNPPLPADAPMVAKLAQIGLIPGKPFEISRLDAATRQALELAVQEGNELVTLVATEPPQLTNGWDMPLHLGDYGTHYLFRASIARNGVGANYFKDAVYGGGFDDNNGDSLDGSHTYQITFPAGQLPPANPAAFWSVTMYNAGLENLVDNPIDRYALGIPAVQDHLPCFNDDGSLTLFVQHDAPADTSSIAYCNWLPAPADGFLLLMRTYWPGQSLFDGSWLPPVIQRTD
jgi:hypothetical protein